LSGTPTYGEALDRLIAQQRPAVPAAGEQDTAECGRHQSGEPEGGDASPAVGSRAEVAAPAGRVGSWGGHGSEES
jgi:hypothetical protein